jgi:antitoxin (DNA-binding transcriptional repressor) of toxin-antitoxin stability system
MVEVNLDEIKQDLGMFLTRVESREKTVILQDGKPIASVIPIDQSSSEVSDKLRPFGLCAGEFDVPDDFDSPLPEHIIQEFEGR